MTSPEMIISPSITNPTAEASLLDSERGNRSQPLAVLDLSDDEEYSRGLGWKRTKEIQLLIIHAEVAVRSRG